MNALSHPLIAIMGTTGVGKSQLAVELALRLSASLRRTAKVINADAMQTFSGMDVITNKISVEEMRGVPHYLIGCKQPGVEYKIAQWIPDALGVIQSIHAEGGIPIVVGGTSYWMQHLLLHSKLPSLEVEARPNPQESPQMSAVLQAAVSTLPKESLDLWENLPPTAPADDHESSLRLHTLLMALDPPMAQRWHWKDVRKLLRSLWVIKDSGRLATDVFASQEEEGAPQPRFPSIVFWLYSRPEKLEPRLDTRVDQMLKNGLLSEVMSMREIAAKISSEDGRDVQALYTHGIFQSIGFKEFDAYLSSPERTQTLFDEGVAATKLATKRYAKTQIMWMEGKMMPAVLAAKAMSGPIDVFVLDATDLERWNEAVKDVAVDLSMKFMRGEPLPEPRSLSTVADELLAPLKPADSPLAILARERKRICPICSDLCKQPMMYVEGREWEEHVRSKKHRGRKLYKERRDDPNYIGNIKKREREEAEAKARAEAEEASESGSEGQLHEAELGEMFGNR
ncbi:tRNA isopentenyltransferase [Calocera viscosa TUFC12733]|uniref:tRNA isopentenyltransferase n=1 Tax=Calocera viscosa (strain TUFC12733) TaxID=1330018 RepID=A0A167HFS5_CALVF|nr:tRNA isopentenyltransferase [Calocera viscosa TUFC12733]